MSGFLHWFGIAAAASVIVASYFALIVAALVWLRRNAARYMEHPINPGHGVSGDGVSGFRDRAARRPAYSSGPGASRRDSSPADGSR